MQLLLLSLLPLALAGNAATAHSNHHSTASRGRRKIRSDERLFLEAQAKHDKGLKALYPFYHTSDQLLEEAKSLVDDCNGAMTMKSVQDGDMTIDVASVKAPGSNPINKVFLLFGEHSRELISPESGLHFLKVLCGKTSTQGEGSSFLAEDVGTSAAETLRDSEFQMVLNGNPLSRRKVEEGDYCLRTNNHGVDLNRNWDEKWQAEAQSYGNANPGPSPFSEPETRIFKKVVSEFKPTTFLTVHSGTRGMYMPYAYDMEHLASRNQANMMQILKELDQDHCECPYGAAGKEVGYPCPGTCIDWVFDNLRTPYAFAFEIYTSPSADSELKQRWTQKLNAGGAQLLQAGNHLGHQHFLDLFHAHESDFVQTKAKHAHMLNQTYATSECFGMFNPDTEERFKATVENWSAAYLKMANKVAAHLKEKGHTNTAVF